MPRTPRDVTDAELAVLRVLWDEGPTAVRRIAEALSAAGPRTQPATVQKLLERLERKEFVVRDRSDEPQRFRAAAGRDELIGRRLQSIAEDLCEGSLTPLLNHLVKRERLTDEDRKALRGLIDELSAGDDPPPTTRRRR